MNSSVNNSLTSCSAAFSKKPQILSLTSFQFLLISRPAHSAQTAEREAVTLVVFLELVYFRQETVTKSSLSHFEAACTGIGHDSQNGT